MRHALAKLLLVPCIALAACSWAPTHPEAPASPTTWASWGDAPGLAAHEASQRPAAQAVDYATGMIGVPYRWGGATPAGFDCSGLVYYTFHKAGVSVPRTSQEQYHAARPVPLAKALPGDLVFFGRRGRISHVGIYLGDERFVHAPETGRNVSVAHLDEVAYRKRFAGAGRIE
jgi:cell wall-associated NlpC family hydrolase